MTGVWVVVDENGETVIEYPGTPSGKHLAEDHMQPGYGLDWEERP